jgi:tetratricopeptide (TPR) repeat protein
MAELGRRVEHGLQAIQSFQSLLQRKPDELTWLGNAAYAHRIVAEGYRESGQPQRTLEHGLKARELTERVIRLSGNPAARKMELSFGIEYVGLGHMESGRFKESLEHFREAIRLREEVHRSNPEDAFVQHRLLNGYMQLGVALEGIEDWAAAQDWHDRVTKLVAKLAVRNDDEWNRTLAWVYSSCGLILAKRDGRHADACGALRLADRHFAALSAAGRGKESGTAPRWNVVRRAVSSCATP